MRYWIYILIGVIVFGGGTVQAVPWEPLLERQAQQAVSSRPTVGQRRFSYLRFYVPSAQLRAQPSWWERFFSSADTQAHQYALAVYLFNMFVSTRIYNQPAPRTLTLDYVGVLDGFEMCQDPFDFRHAVFFYHKYQQEVQKTLNQFLQTRKLPWEAPSQAELEQWVQLLQAVPGHQQKAVYLLAGTSALSVSLPEETVLTPLRALFSQARNQAARVAVLYDEPDVQLEDLDNHIRSHPIRRKRTYRWAKDECNYSSYLTAKKLVQNIVKDKTYWETTRVYLIHAYPNQGTFLMPRVGARFVLADGRQGLHWRYHTAVLVVAEQNRQFYPLILDNLLDGENPMKVGDWLGRFSPQTVFRVVPFRRDEVTENALKIPTATDGTTLWLDDVAFYPAAVEK